MVCQIMFLLALVMSVFFESRFLSASEIWKASERSGLNQDNPNYIKRLISVPLDPWVPQEGEFDLYYFVRKPLELGRKTILFCAGGPGQLLMPGDETSTIMKLLMERQYGSYNVVFFHLRGSGFSQIPRANQFDRFLRTSYAVEDIEKIRQDLSRQGFLGPSGKWDAIVGYSYGTVLAHQYAHRYEDKVARLILAGPLSMHKFTAATAYEEYNREVNQIRKETVQNIYKLPDFKQLTQDEKGGIIDLLFGVSGNPEQPGIWTKIEYAFGSEHFVSDAYCELRNNGELRRYGLEEYGRKLFASLRDIRFVGWQPISSLMWQQAKIGKAIAVSLNPQLIPKLYLSRNDMVLDEGADDCFEDPDQPAHRILYVLRTYDGLLPRFLKEWLDTGKTKIHTALRRSAGVSEKGLNKFLEKIGIADDAPIEPWNPAKFRHSVPTLILKGEADPVTAGGQAEYYYTDALKGYRALIEFEGVGHWFVLPEVEVTTPFLSAAVTLDPPIIPNGSNAWVSGSIPSGPIVTSRPTSVNQELAINTTNYKKSLPLQLSLTFLNVSHNDIDDLEGTWPITYPLFNGTVKLDPPNIPGEQTGWVSGIVIPNAIKLELKKPGNLEAGLTYTGNIRVESWNSIAVEIKNDSPKTMDGAPKNWVYTGPDFSGPCYNGRNPISTRECLLFAFIEMEYADFTQHRHAIIEKIQREGNVGVRFRDTTP